MKIDSRVDVEWRAPWVYDVFISEQQVGTVIQTNYGTFNCYNLGGDLIGNDTDLHLAGCKFVGVAL